MTTTLNASTAGAGGFIATGDNSGSLALQTAGTTAVTIDTSQNVGIGTTSPSYKLDVQGTTANQRISSTTGTNAAYQIFSNSGQNFYVGLDNSAGNQILSAAYGATLLGTGAYPMVFGTNNSERMRIDSSGNLLVGTTSNFSADKMCLNFTSAQNGFAVRDDSNSSGAYYAVFRNSANGVIGSITRVTTTNAVTYNTTSDQRLKSNIADASSVLNKLMNVKVRQFDWTEGNLHQDAGFIAQELSTVLSGIVTEGRTEDDLWQLDYARLTPYLTKAIQELKAINDTQAETLTQQTEAINALTARVVALESRGTV